MVGARRDSSRADTAFGEETGERKLAAQHRLTSGLQLNPSGPDVCESPECKRFHRAIAIRFGRLRHSWCPATTGATVGPPSSVSSTDRRGTRKETRVGPITRRSSYERPPPAAGGG